MRLPWKKQAPEKRNYSDAILGALETAAATKAANVGATAAIEAVAGLLSRTLAGAEVDAPPWAVRAINPTWIAMVCRQLIRDGEHLSLIRMDRNGELMLLPAGHWWFTGGPVEADWTANVSVYGPSGSRTYQAGRDEIAFFQWARLPIEPHRGRSPGGLASLAAKAAAEVEKSLADEAGGPVAQLLPLPEGVNGDTLTELRGDISRARGKALLLESTAGGWGDRAGAPQRDWMQARLGPNPPAPMVALADAVFSRMVAAAGASVSLFTDADGTAQREAVRRFHMTTVLPVAGMIARELSDRLETEIGFTLDTYALDIQARAAALKKFIESGLSPSDALGASGILQLVAENE